MSAKLPNVTPEVYIRLMGIVNHLDRFPMTALERGSALESVSSVLSHVERIEARCTALEQEIRTMEARRKDASGT